jgi:uncharacterized protein YndB with AHSA1/START domain
MAWDVAPEPGTLRWRLHLTEPPETVYRFLSTDVGRESFWAESAKEARGSIDWQFASGEAAPGRLGEHDEPRRFGVGYPDGSQLEFELESDGRNGTDLTLTRREVPEESVADALVHSVSLLMRLKAVVDHGVDLRSHDPDRTWERGFVEE